MSRWRGLTNKQLLWVMTQIHGIPSMKEIERRVSSQSSERSEYLGEEE